MYEQTSYSWKGIRRTSPKRHSLYSSSALTKLKNRAERSKHMNLMSYWQKYNINTVIWMQTNGQIRELIFGESSPCLSSGSWTGFDLVEVTCLSSHKLSKKYVKKKGNFLRKNTTKYDKSNPWKSLISKLNPPPFFRSTCAYGFTISFSTLSILLQQPSSPPYPD